MDLQSGIHVPQELIDLITEFLGHDSRSISKLCLVSRSFCASARSVLYRRIKVVNPTTYRLTRPNPQIVHLDNFTHFLMTIAIYNSHLGQYVHEIHYSPQNSSRPMGFWEVMNKALYHMTNLKIFSFRNFVSPSKRDLFWGTKFQLEEFYWCDGYNFERDGEIAHFLRTQPDLKVLAAPLRLRGSDPHVSLPVLPKLRTFIGDMDAIRRLICIHPIEKLRWRDSPPEVLYSGPNMNTLEASLAKLRVLSIGATRPQSWLTTLTPYLRSLEVLHISALHDSQELHFEFSQILKLKKLRVLIWSPQPSSWVQDYLKDEQGRTVENWFEGSRLLDRVYFYIRNNRVGENGFWCWTRGEPLSVHVAWNELAERESLQEFAPLLDATAPMIDRFPMN